MTKQPISVNWDAIDQLLFENNVLVAVQTMRKHTGRGVNELLELIHNRFDKLAAECPELFKCDIKTYWDNYGGHD